MMSPAMIVAGCRRAMSMAAASRDRADASGGAQACSHARASGPSGLPTGRGMNRRSTLSASAYVSSPRNWFSWESWWSLAAGGTPFREGSGVLSRSRPSSAST